MKVSENFKNIIETYLQQTAVSDSNFAPMLEKSSKNIQQCLAYIVNEVKKRDCCGFADEEIFKMAINYYTDDSITEQKEINCSVVVNQTLKSDKPEIKQEINQRSFQKTVAKAITKTSQTTLNLFES